MTGAEATSGIQIGRYHRRTVIGRRESLVAGLLGLAVIASACHVPRLADEERKARRLPQTSFMYAADGSLITSFHAEENRVVVQFDEIPDIVKRSIIAVEDRRFYDHPGIDLRALIRAAYVDATEGRIVEGGSTITQQYIKNRYLGSDQTISRKVKEAVLAFQLERQLSKNEILTRYLNTVYFGQGAYGIQAAARTYFSETAEELGLQQTALLVGLVQAPSAYDPVDHPDLALQRRNDVLGILRSEGVITEQDYRTTLTSGLGLLLSTQQRYPAPYFVQYVRQWLFSNTAFGADRTEREDLLYRGGIHVYTTLRPDLQRDAEAAVKEILIYPTDPYGAMTVIDPRTGQILAMVGGRDYFSTTDPVAQLNLATGGVTGRQAGSTFKPFALVAAMENGIPPQRVYDAPSSIDIALPRQCQAPGQPTWPVTNFDGTGPGRMTVEQATIDSVNVVYAQIVRDLGGGDACAGAAKVVDVAKELGVNPPEMVGMGISHPLARVPAAVLGAEQVNSVEMASAYGTLANVGYRVPPVAVTKVTDSDGTVLWRAHDRRTLAVDPPVAYVADQILQKVVQEGTGVAAAIGRPAIGKTGTAQEYRDAWFVGAIPQLSAAVWVGFPQGEESMVAPRTRLPAVLGGTWPAQIWHLFMTKAAAHLPVLDFPKPMVRYVTVRIDTSQNCQANAFTPPSLISEVRFIQGTQPPVCFEPTTYQPLVVPSVIGLDVADAAATLARAGFQSVAVARASPQEPGTVIGQDPVAGGQALQASTVALYVAVPLPTPCGPSTPTPTPTPTPAPTGSGQTSPSPSGSASPGASPSPTATSSSSSALAFAFSKPSPSAAPSTSPSGNPGSSPSPSGTSTPSPSATVSPTPTPCASPSGSGIPAIVPDVIGQSRDHALATLQADGFTAAALIISQCSGDAQGCHAKAGVVWRQSPVSGDALLPGSTVTVWVNPSGP
jgi:penicillin-binding protein 1A